MTKATNTRAASLSDPSAEDRHTQNNPSAPRDQAPSKESLTCHRQIERQATSAVAHTAEPPAPDDPLLGFAPVPHKQPRRNSITPDLQRKFIAHLAATGIVSEAARHIGKSMEAIYKLRQRPGAEGFRAAWDAAIDRGVSRLEAGALARAIAGEERMVVSSGKVLGTETRHNEGLVMFFLRHRLPAKYGPERDKPNDAMLREAREEAMAAARAHVRAKDRERLDDVVELLEYMVENRMAGRGYIDGLDRDKTLAENAALIASKGWKGADDSTSE